MDTRRAPCRRATPRRVPRGDREGPERRGREHKRGAPESGDRGRAAADERRGNEPGRQSSTVPEDSVVRGGSHERAARRSPPPRPRRRQGERAARPRPSPAPAARAEARRTEGGRSHPSRRAVAGQSEAAARARAGGTGQCRPARQAPATGPTRPRREGNGRSGSVASQQDGAASDAPVVSRPSRPPRTPCRRASAGRDPGPRDPQARRGTPRLGGAVQQRDAQAAPQPVGERGPTRQPAAFEQALEDGGTQHDRDHVDEQEGPADEAGAAESQDVCDRRVQDARGAKPGAADPASTGSDANS